MSVEDGRRCFLVRETTEFRGGVDDHGYAAQTVCGNDENKKREFWANKNRKTYDDD